MVQKKEADGHHSMAKQINDSIRSVVAMGDDYTHHMTGTTQGPVTHYIGSDHNGNTVTGMDYQDDKGEIHWTRVIWFKNQAPHHCFGVTSA